MSEFIIHGKIMPYVRMTQKTKWYEREQLYLKTKGDIQTQLTSLMNRKGIEPFYKQPLKVKITFIVPNRLHTCDIDNQIKAVFDAANKIVWNDDRYVDKVSAHRDTGGEHVTLLSVEVWE